MKMFSLAVPPFHRNKCKEKSWHFSKRTVAILNLTFWSIYRGNPVGWIAGNAPSSAASSSTSSPNSDRPEPVACYKLVTWFRRNWDCGHNMEISSSGFSFLFLLSCALYSKNTEQLRWVGRKNGIQCTNQGIRLGSAFPIPSVSALAISIRSRKISPTSPQLGDRVSKRNQRP